MTTPISGPSGPQFNILSDPGPTFTQAEKDTIAQATISAANTKNSVISPNSPILLETYYNTFSTAVLQQNVNDLIAALENPKTSADIFRAMELEYERLRGINAQIIQYNQLQNQLVALNLDQKKNDVNTAFTNENTRRSALNSSVDSFNSAQATYTGDLATYKNNLDGLETDQTAYQPDLQAFNTALQTYLAQEPVHTPQQTQDFQDARDQYYNNVTEPQASFTEPASRSAWVTSGTTLANSITTFNNGNAAAVANINNKIQAWNAAVAQATPIVNQMNALRTQLNRPALPLPQSLSLFAAIPNYTLGTSGTDPQVGVNSSIDAVNIESGILNTLINSTNNDITTYNGIHPGTPLASIANQSTFTDLAIPPNANVAANDEALIAGGTFITYTTPAQEPDLQPSSLSPQLALLSQALSAQELKQRASTEEESLRPSAVNDNQRITEVVTSTETTIGGSGSSTALSSLDTKVGASPQLEGILAKQKFEAILNVYGVPAGSALVDQLSLFTANTFSIQSLVAAGTGQDYLGKAAITGPGGQAAFDATFALALFKQLNSGASQSVIQQGVLSLLANNPDVASLTAEQKNALAGQLADAIGAAFLKTAINEIGVALGLPGILPTLLAQAAGVTNPDLLASFQNQIVREITLSDALQKQLNISQGIADQIVLKAFANQQASTQDIIAQANAGQDATAAAAIKQTETQVAEEEFAQNDALQRDLLDQFNLRKILATASQIRAANEASLAAVNQLDARSNELWTRATKQELIAELLAALYNPNQIVRFNPEQVVEIALRTNTASSAAFRRELLRQGISQEAATNIINAVGRVGRLPDGTVNPLGAFLMQQTGSTTELAYYFKLQAINVLSPLLGAEKAKAIAEDFGTTLFVVPNSLLERISVDERPTHNLTPINTAANRFEDFREAMKAFVTPELAGNNPAQLGKTLLLLSVSPGLVSGDTQVGNLAGRSFRHPIDLPA